MFLFLVAMAWRNGELEGNVHDVIMGGCKITIRFGEVQFFATLETSALAMMFFLTLF